jgi:hypothetical protein
MISSIKSQSTSLVGIFVTRLSQSAGDTRVSLREAKKNNISRVELISSQMTRYPGKNGIPRMLGNV